MTHYDNIFSSFNLILTVYLLCLIWQELLGGQHDKRRIIAGSGGAGTLLPRAQDAGVHGHVEYVRDEESAELSRRLHAAR